MVFGGSGVLLCYFEVSLVALGCSLGGSMWFQWFWWFSMVGLCGFGGSRVLLWSLYVGLLVLGCFCGGSRWFWEAKIWSWFWCWS